MLYLTNEYVPDDDVILIWTEEDILDFYYDFWSKSCKLKGVPEERITKQECIEQWMIGNWAYKIQEENLQRHMDINHEDTFITYKEWKERE